MCCWSPGFAGRSCDFFSCPSSAPSDPVLPSFFRVVSSFPHLNGWDLSVRKFSQALPVCSWSFIQRNHLITILFPLPIKVNNAIGVHCLCLWKCAEEGNAADERHPRQTRIGTRYYPVFPWITYATWSCERHPTCHTIYISDATRSRRTNQWTREEDEVWRRWEK